jgi:hypothetical protein
MSISTLLPRSDLKAVGFLHFGAGHGAPLRVLRTALQGTEEQCGNGALAESLIVLPEGFNIHKPYFDRQPPNTDPNIFCDLERISDEFRCAFVAGLMVGDTPGVSPPYNSAYLIDGSHRVLLSRKRKADDTEASRVQGRSWSANYTAYPNFYTIPVSHRGLGIAALVCLEAQSDQEPYPQYRERLEGTALALRRLGNPLNVVCVPMHMSNGLCGGQPGQNITKGTPLEGTIWCAANSHSGQVNSFVTDVSGFILDQIGCHDENKIVIRRLEHCR